MASPKGGKAFEPGVIERISGAIRYTLTGKEPPWFGPNEPIQVMAPPEVKGRPFAFPPGVNLNFTPRSENTGDNAISFGMLRRMADPAQGGLDLVRMAIETVKNELSRQKWVVRRKDGKPDDARIDALKIALRKPDLVHTFRQWSRRIWEDMLVIDAPAIYMRPLAEGFKIPESVDGALIKLILDNNGRIPLPPNIAYQQILYGVPAAEYTIDEMLYSPCNLRTYTMYGYSPVEQMVNIISLGLNRQLHLTGYYTAGNIPEHLIACPEQWQPSQIEEIQDFFDSLLSQPETRRKMIFVPGGCEPKPLRDPKLKDELDEWLAKVICFCFCIPPGALVSDNNRATAETNAQVSQSQGLASMKSWWKDVMDEIILRCWGIDDIEFAYEEEIEIDPLKRAQIAQIACGNKPWMMVNEIREDFGLTALTPEQLEEITPKPQDPFGFGGEDGDKKSPTGDKKIPVKDEDEDEDEDEEKEKVEKKKSIHPIDRERPSALKATKKIKNIMSAYMRGRQKAVLANLAVAQKLQKADFPDLWEDMSEEEKRKMENKIKQALEAFALDASDEAINQIIDYIPIKDIDDVFELANEKAVEWAREHSGLLVSEIDDTTREGVQSLVSRATEEGMTYQELSEKLQEAYGFSEDRAEMIARTETRMADVQGNMIGYRESGVVDKKQWVLAQDQYCDDCAQYALMDPIPLDDEFPEGDPPAHPNCRCDIMPILSTEE